MSKPGRRHEASERALYCEIDGLAVPLQAADLSTAGLFIQTPNPRAIDDEVEIFVRSPVGELFACGQVVQVIDSERAARERRRPGFGLLFTTLEDDQRAFIGLTLARLLKAGPPPAASIPARAPKPSLAPPAMPPALCAQAERVALALRDEILEVQTKSAWSALGLAPDAPATAVKEAFLRVTKRVHPHRYARHDSAEVNQLATELFIAYKRHFATLSKRAARAAGPQSPLVGTHRQAAATSLAPVATSAPPRRPSNPEAPAKATSQRRRSS